MTRTQTTHNTRGNAKKNKKPVKLILRMAPKFNINFVETIRTASSSPANQNEQVVIPSAPIVFQPISPTLTSIPSEMSIEDIIKRFRPGIIYDFLTEENRIAIMEENYVDLLIQQQNVDVISPGLRACENEDNDIPDLKI
jgi:hypothetical protein